LHERLQCESCGAAFDKTIDVRIGPALFAKGDAAMVKSAPFGAGNMGSEPSSEAFFQMTGLPSSAVIHIIVNASSP